MEFWSNHLNITAPSSEAWATKPWDDVHVVRKHALGRFDDMLVAWGTSPAMLRYLDNASSRAKAPNENYARELLELHTAGRDAGYAHDDILGAARALTGLTVWTDQSSVAAGTFHTFRYRAEWHHVGPVRVLEWSHPTATGLAAWKSRTACFATWRTIPRPPGGSRRSSPSGSSPTTRRRRSSTGSRRPTSRTGPLSCRCCPRSS